MVASVEVISFLSQFGQVTDRRETLTVFLNSKLSPIYSAMACKWGTQTDPRLRRSCRGSCLETVPHQPPNLL